MSSNERIVSELVSNVPEFREFMTVKELYDSSEELARAYRDVVEVIDVGPSRADLPVKALVIHGGDERRVLAFAFPHPNEPVGSLTLEYLSSILARRRDYLKALRATWVIVKVADVFGAKLNEGWFKGSFSIRKYVLNYYRPPPYKQVEWTFPIEYKSLKWDRPVPETKALMKLIDEWKPTHIYSLHNAGFTGTYYYITKRPPAAVLKVFKDIPRSLGVPIHMGEPEAPYMKKLSDAVFLMPSTTEVYDWLEKYLGGDPAKVLRHGGSSYDYARKINPEVLELVCEVPYIYDERLSINVEIGIPRRDILKLSLSKSKESLRELKDLMSRVESRMSHDNPFYEALKSFVEYSEKHVAAEERWVEEDPELSRSATVAQAFDSYLSTYWGPLLRYGLLYRALKQELSNDGDNYLRQVLSDVLGRIDDYLSTFNKLAKYHVIPVSNLVKIQVAAITSTLINM